jgi:two-component system, NtrC family, C4-dicarboxylate transport response regulator DctD
MTFDAPPPVFIIDDDERVRSAIDSVLSARGITTMAFATAKAGLAALDSVGHPRIILLDVALSQSDAIDVIHGLRARKYVGKVHLITGARGELAKAIERIGAREGITFAPALFKPLKEAELLALANTKFSPRTASYEAEAQSASFQSAEAPQGPSCCVRSS